MSEDKKETLLRRQWWLLPPSNCTNGNDYDGRQDAHEIVDTPDDSCDGFNYSCSHLHGHASTDPVTRGNIGLRFKGVAIPQGANITKAQLGFGGAEGDNPQVDVYGEAIGDSANFVDNPTVNGRSTLSPTVSWSECLDSGSTIEWSQDIFAPVIEGIVGQPTWQSGNDMTVILKGKDATVPNAPNCSVEADGYFRPESSVEDSDSWPRIRVEYTPGPAPVTVNSIDGFFVVNGVFDSGANVLSGSDCPNCNLDVTGAVIAFGNNSSCTNQKAVCLGRDLGFSNLNEPAEIFRYDASYLYYLAKAFFDTTSAFKEVAP